MNRPQVGTSGAIVSETLFGHIQKIGLSEDVTQRVIAQGQWLRKYEHCHGLPRVIGMLPNGYMMPKYRELTKDMDMTDSLVGAYHQLRDSIWEQKGDWNIIDVWSFEQKNQFRKYLIKLICKDGPINSGILITLLDQGILDQCTRCETHGDPILDNIMIDNEGLIWADPIPSYAGSPQLRAVDLGKILQSAYGYEVIKYQDVRWLVDEERIMRVLSEHETEVDIRAAIFFCAVHFLRLIPYQTNEVKRETYRKIVAALCTSL